MNKSGAISRLFISFLLLVMLTVSVFRPAQAQQPYYIPPNQFNAAMEIMDLGFANIFGLFQNATGSFTFEESTKTVSHLRLAIDATSLMTSNSDNQEALLALFDADHYPEISLTASESYSFTEGKADIKATLTLHGISKPIVLTATLNRTGKSPYGGGMWSSEGEAMGLSMRGSFKRADFGLSDASDNARFGDTMTFMLETQAIRQ